MKNLKTHLALVIIAFFHVSLLAQVGINSTNSAPDNTAMLDVSSTAKGFLMPRMTFAARNNIITPATGLMLFNTSTNVFDFYNGSSWLSLGATSNSLWNSNGNSIYNLNSANVGIGISNPTQAKFVVNGEVTGQTALFKSVSGVSVDGSNNPSLGFNVDNGYPIIAGTGSILSFNPTSSGGSSGTLSLDFYTQKPLGTLFSTTKNILKYRDFSSFGLGTWLDLNNISGGRLNVPDIMYSESNGNLNLIPLGAIYFKFDNLHQGFMNVNKLIRNVGTGANLVASSSNFNYYNIGPSYFSMHVNLNSLTKQYDEIIIVGSPSIYNFSYNTRSSYVNLYRGDPEKDIIRIGYLCEGFDINVEVYGTLLIYGAKN